MNIHKTMSARDADARSSEPVRHVLEVENLRTTLRTPHGLVRVVDGVSFGIEQGRTLAIVGESGSGKTMLSRSIIGLMPSPPALPLEGCVRFDGRDLARLRKRELDTIRGRDIAMVFQDPMTSLNPVIRVGEQISEVLRHHLRMSRSEAWQRALELLREVGVPSPAQRLKEYPHQLSGGLRQRVVIAMALACGPRLLLADEPTTALDVTIQAQILALLKRYQRQTSMAMIFVSHDLATVAGIADEIAVMYAGSVVEHGPTRQVLSSPRMPYTQALLRSIPRLDAVPHQPLDTIGGRPPDPLDPPLGCAFAPRCPRRQDDCLARRPVLTRGDHRYACFHPNSDARETT